MHSCDYFAIYCCILKLSCKPQLWNGLQRTAQNCAARLCLFIRPITFLVCGVVVPVAFVDAKALEQRPFLSFGALVSLTYPTTHKFDEPVVGSDRPQKSSMIQCTINSVLRAFCSQLWSFKGLTHGFRQHSTQVWQLRDSSKPIRMRWFVKQLMNLFCFVQTTDYVKWLFSRVYQNGERIRSTRFSSKQTKFCMICLFII